MAGLGYILLGSVVKSYWTLFLVYLFISTGQSAGFFAPVMASVNQWFVRRRTQAISIVGASQRGAAFVAPPVLAFLVLRYGWQSTAIMVGVGMAIAILLVFWVFRPPPSGAAFRADLQSPETIPDNPAVRAGTPSRPASSGGHDFTVREAIKTSTFWLLVAAQGCRFIIQGSLMVHMVPIFVSRGLEEQSAANLLAVMAFISIPCVLLLGWAGDRFTLKRVAAAGTLSGAIGMALLAFGTEPWQLLPFAVLNGVADATFPVIISMTGEYFGRRSFATLRGIAQLFTSTFSFAATYLIGWVFDLTGGYRAALIPLVFVAAAGVPLFLAIRYPPVPHSTPPRSGS